MPTIIELGYLAKLSYGWNSFPTVHKSKLQRLTCHGPRSISAAKTSRPFNACSLRPLPRFLFIMIVSRVEENYVYNYDSSKNIPDAIPCTKASADMHASFVLSIRGSGSASAIYKYLVKPVRTCRKLICEQAA